MNDPLKRIPFEAIEDGMMAGFGHRPEGGAEWRSDLTINPFEDDRPTSGPWLVPKGDAWLRYPVLRRAALFEDFVRLSRRPSQANIRRFVDRYGFLGELRLLAPIVGSGPAAFGESLDTWHAELHRIAALETIWKYVEQDNRERLALFVRWMDDPRRAVLTYVIASGQFQIELTRRAWDGTLEPHHLPKPSEARLGVFLAHPHILAENLERWTFGDVIEPARYFVHMEVNRALRGHINMSVLPYRRGQISFFPDSLLAAIYLQFAHRLAGLRGSERECAFGHCRRRFVRARRDQQYCSKNCRELAAYYRRRPLDKLQNSKD